MIWKQCGSEKMKGGGAVATEEVVYKADLDTCAVACCPTLHCCACFAPSWENWKRFRERAVTLMPTCECTFLQNATGSFPDE